MKKVYICSRYRADDAHTVEKNVERAEHACRAAALAGYAPYVPHLYLPDCLEDDIPKEREMGLTIGQKFLKECDEVWQWGTEISEGMAAELELARELGIPIRVFDNTCGPVLRELTGSYAFIRHGEWQDQYNDGDWHCSVCGAIVEKDEQIRHNWLWCYHCGAKMNKKDG